MRWHIRILLVIGALASVATQPSYWDLDMAGDVPAGGVLDPQTPTARYLVHIELRGPGPIDSLSGDMTTTVTLTPRVPLSNVGSLVRFEVRPLTHPDETIEGGLVDLLGGTSWQVMSDIWLACDAHPCVEEYEINLALEAAMTLPPIDIGGNVLVHTSAPGDAPPANTEVVVTVTGPLL